MRQRQSPDQLQWVVDHNMQIRAGHRVQIYDAVAAWRKDREAVTALMALIAAIEPLEADFGTNYPAFSEAYVIARASVAEIST